ncbi:MAG: DUF1698 domain-containing protein [Candidatus Eremiobacteraeota bacterium]|nr:DUF1698 domain-containing protein [Candidatus Eremiobacteraeota bacterium]
MSDSEKAGNLEAVVKSHFWWHSIDLGNGIVTPGHKPPNVMKEEFDNTFSGIDLEGRTVLDVGTWNGAFAVEAWRRGAASVTGLDHYTWHNDEFRGRETFDLVSRVTGANLQAIDRDLDVPHLDLSDIGRFDVVLFLGVFYHLRNPLTALREVSAAAKEVLVLESHIERVLEKRPAMVFYPTTELGGDASNWWGPNRRCLFELLKFSGFAWVEEGTGSADDRAIFRAYRTKPPNAVEKPARRRRWLLA